MTDIVKLTQSVIDNPKFRVPDDIAQRLLNKIAELEKERDIRDLEQQAKGVEDAFNESSRILKSKKYAKKAYLGIIDLTAELCEYGDNLRNQAKALKEGE